MKELKVSGTAVASDPEKVPTLLEEAGFDTNKEYEAYRGVNNLWFLFRQEEDDK